MDVDEAADLLYRLPPEAFTAERTRLVQQARAAGDRNLAKQVASLRRPTAVGWLANQLVHRHPEQVAALVELGDGLRSATASLNAEQLRVLTRQQHQLVTALVRQARSDAAEAGRRVSPDAERALADTIQAALADPASAQLLSAGHLVDGLTPPSDLPFGTWPVPARPVDPSDALADATTDVTPGARHEVQLTLARARAERAVAQARAAFEHAAQHYDEAEQSTEAASLAAASAQRDLTELTERLAEAQHAVRAAEVQEEKAARLLEHAAEQRSTAEQALRDAEALLAELGDGTNP